MTSAPMRDPLADHLLTPQNAALLLIDYQPSIPDKFAQWDAAYVLGALSSAERREFEEYLAALPDGRLGAGRRPGFAGPGITSVPDDELMAELIATPRIGPWTLQGGLLLAPQREDVVLPGDPALRQAVQAACQLDHLRIQQEVLAIAEEWRPYGTLATTYRSSAAFEPVEALPVARLGST